MSLLPTLREKLSMPMPPQGSMSTDTANFWRGIKATHNDLEPIHQAMLECVALLETNTDSRTCVCNLNPLVDGPVPCNTCQQRNALAALKKACGCDGQNR